MTAWDAIREAPRRIGEAAQQARPQLRGILSPPRRIAPAPFAVLVVALLVSGMVLLLLLNTHLQDQAFQVRDAERRAAELGYHVSDLEARVTRAKAPGELARRASDLGMVPNPYSVYIDLATGRVVGQPIPVRGDEMPSLRVLPPPPPEPEAPADGEQPADGTVPADGAATPEGTQPAHGTAQAADAAAGTDATATDADADIEATDADADIEATDATGATP